MKYVALLRGINVGGNNKVDMKTLVKILSENGFHNVSFYLNTGNIFFESDASRSFITKTIESLISDVFLLDIKVLIHDKNTIDQIMAKVPDDWENNKDVKCNVLFLWEKYDNASVLNILRIRENIDTVYYQSGAVLWRVLTTDYSKSGMSKLVGTDLYKNMTIRNVNTARKIWERLSAM